MVRLRVIVDDCGSQILAVYSVKLYNAELDVRLKLARQPHPNPDAAVLAVFGVNLRNKLV